MEYVKLGNSDLRVSRICLGCMGFGDPTIGQHSWTIGEEPTREIIRRSLDLGVNFFDTAIAYQLGTSEQYVGRALRDMARREDVVVATKFLPRTDEEIATVFTPAAFAARSISTGAAFFPLADMTTNKSPCFTPWRRYTSDAIPGIFSIRLDFAAPLCSMRSSSSIGETQASPPAR